MIPTQFPSSRGCGRFALAGVILVSAVGSRSAAGQSAPYTLSQVSELVKAAVPTPLILERVKKSCIDFRITKDNERIIRIVGGDAKLIAGLRSTCYRGAETGPTPKKPAVKRSTVVEPSTVKKVLVEPTISPDDTLPTVYDRDYTVVRDVPIMSDSICRKSFDMGAYTIRKRPGHTCEMTELTKLGDARIELQLAIVSASLNTDAGLKFGVSEDGNIFYAFDIDEAGRFVLQQLLDNHWRTLIPWTPSRSVKTGSNVTNTLAVRAEGRSVTLYVNGDKVGSYFADALVTGYAGVGIFGSTGEATVVFRRLRALGQRLPNPTTPVVTERQTTYGPYALGMSLAEVLRLVYPDGSRDAWTWSSLPVADEYPNKDVRYFWLSLRDIPSLPDADLFAPCIGTFGNIVFLFTRTELVRISIRFDSSGCADPLAMLSQFAARNRLPRVDNPGVYYQRFTPDVHELVAKIPPVTYVIEFIKAGSPRYTNEPWCNYVGGLCQNVP